MFFFLSFILVGYSLLQDGLIFQNAQHLENVTTVWFCEIESIKKHCIYHKTKSIPVAVQLYAKFQPDWFIN